MTGGARTAPSADLDRLGRVLAGDPVACGLLALVRSLADAELDALILHVEQVGVGGPAVNATTAPWRKRRLMPS